MVGRECPMCGTVMRRVLREITTHVPGSPRPHTTTFYEWVCPDCDYFEEAEEETEKST